MISNKLETRKHETTIDLPADADRVWQCLVEAEHLTNWFPPNAQVEPGVGGALRMSWSGSNWGESGRITIWEPGRHLAVASDTAWGGPEPIPVTHEYILEARDGGQTRLRLVHSGFAAESEWDDIFDGTRRGWAFELRGLRHYLAHHFGTKREVVATQSKMPSDDMGTWDRIMRALGAPADLPGRQEGDRVELKPVQGDPINGELRIVNPPRDLCMTAANHNQSMLRVCLDSICSTEDGAELKLWLSTYGLGKAQRDSLQGQLEHIIEAVTA